MHARCLRSLLLHFTENIGELKQRGLRSILSINLSLFYTFDALIVAENSIREYKSLD